jgi:hypothetical protein
MRIILICISIMVGCSGLGACSTVLTEDELFARDWKRGIDAQNWELCDYAYRKAGRPTVHRDHRHTRHGIRHMNPDAAIRSDLLQNDCRIVLRDYWIDY